MSKNRVPLQVILRVVVNHLEKFDQIQCVFCGEKDLEKLCLDHAVSIFMGGQTVPENLQFACKPCNSSKGHKRGTPKPKAHEDVEIQALVGVS